MTFGAVFPRVMRPAFGPVLAVAGIVAIVLIEFGPREDSDLWR